MTPAAMRWTWWQGVETIGALPLGLLLLAVAMLGSLHVGAVPLDVFPALKQGLASLLAGDRMTGEPYVLYQIRLPRVLFGALVGAALGASGAALQALFRNPLADPVLIGISGGATLGAVAAIVLGGILIHLSPFWMAWTVPATAFIGALAATLIIVQVGARRGGLDVTVVLLAGIAMNSIVMAGIGILTYVADDQQLRGLTFWTMGSLALADWTVLPVLALVITLPLLLLLTRAEALDRYLLGEAAAMHVGVDVPRLKWAVVLAVALAVGAAVSFSGAIGFVGLVVPHLVRLVFGVRNRVVLPGSMLLGALVMLGADAVGRILASPAEIPVGLVLGTVGGPFFFYLVIRQRGRAS